MKSSDSPIRSFIAIELPAEVKKSLYKLILNLQNDITNGFRWVAIDNIHLTLKFLGDVQRSVLACLSKELAENNSLGFEFAISLARLGVFPNQVKPRILWVGIQAPKDLYLLQKKIEDLSESFGIPPEDRPFSPHLTLARGIDPLPPNAVRAVQTCISHDISNGFNIPVNVDCITLFQSELTPKGPVYTPWAKVQLKPDPSLLC